MASLHDEIGLDRRVLLPIWNTVCRSAAKLSIKSLPHYNKPSFCKHSHNVLKTNYNENTAVAIL